MANFTEPFLAIDDSDPTAHDLWQCFRVELYIATEKFIPHKLEKSRNGLPYLTKDIKRLMRKRDKLHAHKDPRCKILKHVVQNKLRCAHYQYVEDIINPSNNDNPLETKKRFGVLLKHAKCDNTGVHPLKSNEPFTSDPKGKASLLNTYFFSIYQRVTTHPKAALSVYNP